MTSDSVAEERVCGKVDTQKVKQQMALFQDLMRSAFREGEHSFSHSDLIELVEPPFIRRSTCSDTDCSTMKAGYIFL